MYFGSYFLLNLLLALGLKLPCFFAGLGLGNFLGRSCFIFYSCLLLLFSLSLDIFDSCLGISFNLLFNYLNIVLNLGICLGNNFVI